MGRDPARRSTPSASDTQRGMVVRRDADGDRQVGPSWESVTERLIREAQDRGELDGLPGHGRPLRVDENPWARDMALAFHVLHNAGVAPPWIEADKEARRLLSARDDLLRRAVGASPSRRAALRRELEAIITEHAAAVGRLNAEAPSARQHRRPLRPDEERSALEAAFGGTRSADPGAPDG